MQLQAVTQLLLVLVVVLLALSNTALMPNSNSNGNGNGNGNSNGNGNGNKALTEDWKSWLRLNLARGCKEEELFERCVHQEGFCSGDVLLLIRREKRLVDKSDHHDACKTSGSKKMATIEDLESTQCLVSYTAAAAAAAATTTNTNTNTSSSSTAYNNTSLNNGWKEWIRLRLDQGVTKEDLWRYCCLQERLDLDQVSQALGGYRSRNFDTTPSAATLTMPAFTRRSFRPRAWRLDTDLAEVYEIPNFFSQDECQQAVQVIDQGVLERSVVTQPDALADTRTSRTCHLRLTNEDENNNNIVARIEHKLCHLMGEQLHPRTHAEPLQGQVYSQGQFFDAHTDWFAPGTSEYEKHCAKRGGQRTWTVMIYLNTLCSPPQEVEETAGGRGGGATSFELLERTFFPIAGTALAWNNLDADSVSVNPWTLHKAMPVLTQNQKKYVLTKWYRQQSMV